MSKMNVACLLTSWYSMSLEATLQATGFEDDVVDFINGNVDRANSSRLGHHKEWTCTIRAALFAGASGAENHEAVLTLEVL